VRTQRLEAVLVRNEFLSARKAHLLEPASDTEDDAAGYHLVDALSSCPDKGPDSGGPGSEQQEPSSACDIRQAATDSDDDCGPKVPAEEGQLM
jgi:hypothetical protein